MKSNFKKIIKVWLFMASRVAQLQLINNWSAPLFLIGKIVRFGLTFIFIFSLLSANTKLSNYSRDQVIVFFLIFNLVDITSQAFFRGVYQFRRLVVSGDYDMQLLKPLPSLFIPVFGLADFLDIITLIPLWLIIIKYLINLNLMQSYNFLFFLIFLVNSLLIAFAFHLIVCSVCILTTEIDHLVWIYRGIVGIAKVPTDIYPRLVQGLLTFIVPATILMTVPAKALLGFLTWPWAVLAFAVGGFSLYFSFRFWNFALKRYSSASS